MLLRLLTGNWTPFLRSEPKSGEGNHSNGRLEKLRYYLADKYAVSVNQVFLTCSGRSAIYAILRSLSSSDKANKEIILPSFLCGCAADPALQLGYKLVYADIGEDLNMSYSGFLKVVSKDTVAVLIPHLNGVWNKGFDEICDYSRKAGIVVIEDAAQAVGLACGVKKAGKNGDFSVLSFGVGKMIFAPMGGAVIAHRDSSINGFEDWALDPSYIARRHKTWTRLRQSPARRGMWWLREKLVKRHKVLDSRGISINGLPIKLDEKSAGMVLDRAFDVAEKVSIRKKNACFWLEIIKTASWKIEWSHAPLNSNTFLKFWIKLPCDTAQKFKAHLWNSGVEFEELYSPLHLRKSYRSYGQPDLPVTERLYKQVFTLPVRHDLTGKDLARIKKAVSSFQP